MSKPVELLQQKTEKIKDKLEAVHSNSIKQYAGDVYFAKVVDTNIHTDGEFSFIDFGMGICGLTLTLPHINVEGYAALNIWLPLEFPHRAVMGGFMTLQDYDAGGVAQEVMPVSLEQTRVSLGSLHSIDTLQLNCPSVLESTDATLIIQIQWIKPSRKLEYSISNEEKWETFRDNLLSLRSV